MVDLPLILYTSIAFPLLTFVFKSFATITLKCDAGLMITASHNPKYDNGYKAYWTNGAQVCHFHHSGVFYGIRLIGFPS